MISGEFPCEAQTNWLSEYQDGYTRQFFCSPKRRAHERIVKYNCVDPAGISLPRPDERKEKSPIEFSKAMDTIGLPVVVLDMFYFEDLS